MKVLSMERPPYPTNFHFTPYPHQMSLIKAVFDTIVDSSCGCFESPTGTGKSLSVIYAALSWLTEQEHAIIKTIESGTSSQPSTSATDCDWLFAMQNETQNLSKDEVSLDRFRTMVRRIDNARNGLTRYNMSMKKPLLAVTTATKVSQTASSLLSPDDEFAPSDYDSDAKQGPKKSRKRSIDDSIVDIEDDSSSNLFPKIFYCSRTHSQIAQFVGEIKNSPFKHMRCVTLGSRKNMCINKEVLRLNSDAAISERCLMMQKSKSSATAADKKVPSSASKKNSEEKLKACEFNCGSKVKEFADNILADIGDIEDIVTRSKQVEACSYYATRTAMKDAQIVCLPYNMLLSADMRAAMGIELAGSVVLIDEAHNLVEAVNQIHSAHISLSDIDVALAAVKGYLKRFQNLLAGKNLFYVQLFISVLQALKRGLVRKRPDEAPVAALNVNDFLFSFEIDDVNYFKLRRHIESTNLVHKVCGYVEYTRKRNSLSTATSSVSTTNAVTSVKAENKKTETINVKTELSQGADAGMDDRLRTAAALRAMTALLSCLVNMDSDGRIVVSRPSMQPLSQKDTVGNGNSQSIVHKDDDVSAYSIKFVMLNPTVHFKDITDKARAVILLGGTMQPFSYIISQLFSSVPKERLRTFACGHVVPRSSVCTLVLQAGPRNIDFQLTHAHKMDDSVVLEVLYSLCRLAEIVPNGIIAFFTSYSYMEYCVARWRQWGKFVLLEALKRVFVEPREAGDLEKFLLSYGNRAKDITCGGAVLLCVIGGKLSEGINFANELARCVVVVGMPFPDKRDPVLQIKMKHADSLDSDGGGSKLYEAMCMKAVNQSIGRSIRHAKDYASIVLLDKRYSQPKVQELLPGWIRDSLIFQNPTRGRYHLFGEVVGILDAFYKANVDTG